MAESLDPGASSFCRADYNARLESYSNGASVTTWTDRSGNGLHLTPNAGLGDVAPTCLTNARNGHRALRFNGTNNALAAALASDWNFLHTDQSKTIFLVVKRTTARPFSMLFDTNNGLNANVGTYAAFVETQTVDWRISNGSVANMDLSPASILYNNNLWMLLTLRYTPRLMPLDMPGLPGWDARISLNGLVCGGVLSSDYTFSAAAAHNVLTVGAEFDRNAAYFAPMDLARLLFMDTDFDGEELAAYERYLIDEWALGWRRRLVASHAWAGGPLIARFPEGHLYTVWSHQPRENGGDLRGVQVPQKQSGDRGQSWSTMQHVAGDKTKEWYSEALFRTAAGTLLVNIYDLTSGTGSNNWIRSLDGGVTWSTSLTLATAGFTLDSGAAGDMCEQPAGTLHAIVLGRNIGETAYSARQISSTDEGVTWSSPGTVVATGSGTFNYGEGGVVALGGTSLLAVLRNDQAPVSMRSSLSTDQGATWGPVLTILPGYAARPALTKLASGTLVLLTRPSIGNRRAVARWSSNNGVTWSSTDYLIGPVDGWNSYGDFTEESPGVLYIVSALQPTGLMFVGESAIIGGRHYEADILAVP